MEKTKLELQAQFHSELALLCKKYPGIKALVFAGYDEFEYASAGQIGHGRDIYQIVSYVLLKHPDVKHIIETAVATVNLFDQLSN